MLCSVAKRRVLLGLLILLAGVGYRLGNAYGGCLIPRCFESTLIENSGNWILYTGSYAVSGYSVTDIGGNVGVKQGQPTVLKVYYTNGSTECQDPAPAGDYYKGITYSGTPDGPYSIVQTECVVL